MAIELGNAMIREMPRVIIDFVEPETRRLLYENGKYLDLGYEFFKRIKFGNICCNDWSCVAIAEAKIGYTGVKSFNIVDFKKILCDFRIYVDDEEKSIFTIETVLFNDNVEIINIDSFIKEINSKWCKKCGKRNNECQCIEEKITQERDKKFNSIIIDDKTIWKAGPFSSGKMLECKIFDSTGLFANKANPAFGGPAEKDKDEVDIEKFMPVIKGVCQSFKIDLNTAKENAREIVKSNKFITQEGLAAELIKNSR